MADDAPEKQEAALRRLIAENQLTLDECSRYLKAQAKMADRLNEAIGKRLKEIAGRRARGEKVDDAEVERLLEQQQEAIAAYTAATEYIDQIKLAKGANDGKPEQRGSSEDRRS